MSVDISFADDAAASGFVVRVGASESWSMLSLIAAAREQGQPPADPFSSPAPAAPTSIDFGEMAPGVPAAPVRIAPGCSAVLENGGLSVVANYAQTACYIDEKFTEGRITFKVKRGPFIIGWHIDSGGNGWNIWSGTAGDKIYFGYLLANGNGNQINTPVDLPGSAGEDIFITIETGPNVQGSPFKVWAWPASGQKPQTPTLAGSYLADGTYGGAPLNSGVLRVTTYGNTPAVLRSVEIEQGVIAPAFTQAAFNGRWLPRWENGMPVMSTTRAGASFRVQATGSDKLFGTFSRSPNSSENPVLAVFKDGQFVRHVQIAATGEVELINGLNPAELSNIEVFVSGVNQMDSKWRWASGVQLNSLRMSSGRIDPWLDTRPKAIWHGDSITEGSSAKVGQGSIPLNSCGECTYAVLASNALGLSPIVNGFGGLGVAVAGSGAWPPAPVSANWLMYDRPVAAESPEYVFISFGTNEVGVSYAVMKDSLVAFINDQKARYPLASIVLIAPHTGAQTPANIQAAYETGAKLIDLSGVLSSADTTDGVHPTVSGHVKLANALVVKLNALQ